MRKFIVTLLSLSLFFISDIFAQNVQLEGYAYETGNRGYLNLVVIKVYDSSNNLITKTASDMSGIFKLDLPIGQDFVVTAAKDIFKERKMAVSTVGKASGEKLYMKVEMTRQPGYIFDVTLAAKRTEKQIKANEPSDAISGARIEVYNNTKQKQIIDIKDSQFPNFKVHFEDGNHYTIMVRRKGFFTKRMEAYVNVKGCILCFDGVGEIKPGVSDIMTEENTMGTLLANVEMQKVDVGKEIKVDNIYYNKNSAKIRDDAAEELDKLIVVLQDNPTLMIELGSHTDSRGETKFNQKLSQKRAESAVNYIRNNGDIETFKIKAKGYGESKLVNRCKNGVECSERRHQQNRRTEIKVTGVLAEDPFENKSLADIKAAERQEALLLELMNQEVIEVKAGEDLPDEIKKQMEGSKDDSKPAATTIPEPEIAPKEDIIEQVEIISVPPSDVSKPKIEVAEEKIVDTSAKTSPTNTPVTTGSTIYKPAQPTEPVVRTSEKKNKIKAKRESTSSNSKIISDLEVNSNYKPKAPLGIASNFTGYMVEFYSAPKELSSNHKIFSKHGKIYKEKKKDGDYAYLFGPFGEWRDANMFLQTAVSSNYKNSKVIRYKNGKRM